MNRHSIVVGLVVALRQELERSRCPTCWFWGWCDAAAILGAAEWSDEIDRTPPTQRAPSRDVRLGIDAWASLPSMVVLSLPLARACFAEDAQLRIFPARCGLITQLTNFLLFTMKTARSTSYRVSNNFSTTTRSGRVSGGAGARSKDEESSRNASKRGSKANAEAPEAMLAGTAGTPAKQAKRRDQKATPDSRAITKAKEMATRKDGNPTAGTAPITDLTGGSGGTGQERAPLGRDDLASASKVLFGDVAEEKQTQGTPKSFLQYDTEEEALEAAVAEVKAAEGNQ